MNPVGLGRVLTSQELPADQQKLLFDKGLAAGYEAFKEDINPDATDREMFDQAVLDINAKHQQSIIDASAKGGGQYDRNSQAQDISVSELMKNKADAWGVDVKDVDRGWPFEEEESPSSD